MLLTSANIIINIEYTMKRLFQWMIAAILICGATTFTSCSVNDDNPFIAPTDEPGAAYRAVLQSLDWGQDTTFVYGHKVPDVDAVCSALSYAKLMRTLGYNCKAKVSSPINR
jgi:manganese-dependent inorganic pyrophosphatase